MGEDLSTQMSTGQKEDDEGDTFLEEVVKITRHGALPSDQNDDAGIPAMQCCLCGRETMERCFKCSWAPYCR